MSEQANDSLEELFFIRRRKMEKAINQLKKNLVQSVQDAQTH